jgi:hypothetical protein
VTGNGGSRFATSAVVTWGRYLFEAPVRGYDGKFTALRKISVTVRCPHRLLEGDYGDLLAD